MLVVKPVSVKIVLPSDSDKPLLVLVEPVSVPPIFRIWLALVMAATAVVDVAAFSIVPFKANEEAIGGTISSVPLKTSSPAADPSLLPTVAGFRYLRSRKGFGSDMGEPRCVANTPAYDATPCAVSGALASVAPGAASSCHRPPRTAAPTR